MNFSEYLQKAMDEKGVTKADLAKRAKVSPTSIYSWLRSETVPTGRSLVALSRGLDINLEELKKFDLHIDYESPSPRRWIALMRQNAIRVNRDMDDRLVKDDSNPIATKVVKKILEGSESILDKIHQLETYVELLEDE